MWMFDASVLLFQENTLNLILMRLCFSARKCASTKMEMSLVFKAPRGGVILAFYFVNVDSDLNFLQSSLRNANKSL